MEVRRIELLSCLAPQRGDSQGYNLSIICETHVTRKTQLKLEDDFRFGNDTTNNDLPVGV